MILRSSNMIVLFIILALKFSFLLWLIERANALAHVLIRTHLQMHRLSKKYPIKHFEPNTNMPLGDNEAKKPVDVLVL